MTRDWDLWPWMVNDQARGVLGVTMYRFELGIRAMQVVIGEKLLPAIERTAASVKAFAQSLARQKKRTGVKG